MADLYGGADDDDLAAVEKSVPQSPQQQQSSTSSRRCRHAVCTVVTLAVLMGCAFLAVYWSPAVRGGNNNNNNNNTLESVVSHPPNNNNNNNSSVSPDTPLVLSGESMVVGNNNTNDNQHNQDTDLLDQDPQPVWANRVWTELVGQTAPFATAVILNETNHQVKIVVLGLNSLYTLDYNLYRVLLFVETNDKHSNLPVVVRAPRPG